MRKVVTVFLVLFIVIIFSFVVIRYFANASQQDNWFNNNWRAKLAVYPWLRTVFGLHWDGDARSDYLSSKQYTSLQIEVDRYDGCQLSDTVLAQVKSAIEQVVQKPAGVTVAQDSVLPLVMDSYDGAGIHAIVNMNQRYKTGGRQAVLYLLCLNKSSDRPSNIGLTEQADGLVVYWQTIEELTAGDDTSVDDYVISTILHEFGHQLGLNHINIPGCLMAETVESPARNIGLQVTPTAYCPQELEAIEKNTQSLYN